jgi:hypothetical protein
VIGQKVLSTVSELIIKELPWQNRLLILVQENLRATEKAYALRLVKLMIILTNYMKMEGAVLALQDRKAQVVQTVQ